MAVKNCLAPKRASFSHHAALYFLPLLSAFILQAGGLNDNTMSIIDVNTRLPACAPCPSVPSGPILIPRCRYLNVQGLSSRSLYLLSTSERLTLAFLISPMTR